MENIIQLSDETIIDILGYLDMFSNVKIQQLGNRLLYENCCKNILWKEYYESLFDREIITSNSIHDGPITWSKCKVGNYPGYYNIYDPITDIPCKNKKHYTNLEQQKMKREFKNYQQQTAKRYKTLCKNDASLKWKHSDEYELRHCKKMLKSYQKAIVELEEKKIACEKAKEAFNF